jgi:hypothetical protein
MPRKTTVIDPEGNKVTTKTRQTNVFGPKGSSKVVTKFATPESFKKRKQVETYSAPTPSDDELGIKSKGGATKKMYKTGGMVNANSKVSASKTATGRVGGITKAISKVAVKAASPKGRVGGISTVPKKASPKKK